MYTQKITTKKIPAYKRPESGLWNSDDCADFFRCTQRHFMNRIRPQVTFPKARTYPTIGGRSRPTWSAREVQEWAEKFMDYA